MCGPAACLALLCAFLIALTSFFRPQVIVPSAARKTSLSAAGQICVVIAFLTAFCDILSGCSGKIASDMAIASLPMLMKLEKDNRRVLGCVELGFAVLSAVMTLLSSLHLPGRSLFYLMPVLLAVYILLLFEFRFRWRFNAEDWAGRPVAVFYSDLIYSLCLTAVLGFSLTVPLAEDFRPMTGLCLSLASSTVFVLVVLRHLSDRPLVILDRVVTLIGEGSMQSNVRHGDKDMFYHKLYIRIEDKFKADLCFLDENYSLTLLSEEMFTNKSYVSRAISTGSGLNFCQYVNSYRIRYVMDAFLHNPRLKIVEMASLSGFKSMSAFIRAFRTYTGENPSDWSRRHTGKLSD